MRYLDLCIKPAALLVAQVCKVKLSVISVAVKRLFRITLMLFACVSVLLVCGCTFNHAVHQTKVGAKMMGFAQSHTAGRSHRWVLPLSSRLLLLYPVSGPQVQSQMPRLSFNLAQQLTYSVERNFQSATLAEVGVSLTDAFVMAQKQGCNVVIRTEVTAVSDDVSSIHEFNEFYGLAGREKSTLGVDRLALRFYIYDVYSRKRLDTFVVSGKTGVFALTGRSPNQLVDGAIHALSVGMSPKQWTTFH